MAQIDMKNAKIKKSTDVKPAEAPEQLAESTDNASEKQENTNEIDKSDENKEEKTDTKASESGKAVLTYVGSSVWKDAKGEFWARENKTQNILSERQYDMSEYEDREDLKFMVKYGEMKLTRVGK